MPMIVVPYCLLNNAFQVPPASSMQDALGVSEDLLLRLSRNSTIHALAEILYIYFLELRSGELLIVMQPPELIVEHVPEYTLLELGQGAVHRA